MDVPRVTAAIARGDNAALDEFYRVWFDRCYAMARGITGRDESFCLDVVQDATLRVVKSMRAMAAEEDLERWMKRIVHTAALDRLRQERRRSARESGRSAEIPSHGAPTTDELGERIAWVQAQLGLMETHDRMLLVARVSEGRTLDDAGRLAGMTGDAAHGRVRRVLKRLRAAAKEAFGD